MRQILGSLENKTQQIEQYDFSGKDTEQEIQEEEKGEQLYDDVTANDEITASEPLAPRQGQTIGQETNEGDGDYVEDEPVIEKAMSAAVSEDVISNPQSYKTTKEKFEALGRWQENRQGLIKTQSNISDMNVMPAPPIPLVNQFNEVSIGAQANQTQGAPFLPTNPDIDDEAIVMNSPGRRRSVRASKHNVDGMPPEEEEDEFL